MGNDDNIFNKSIYQPNRKNHRKNQQNLIEHSNSDISSNTQINFQPKLLLFDHRRNLSRNLELNHAIDIVIFIHCSQIHNWFAFPIKIETNREFYVFYAQTIRLMMELFLHFVSYFIAIANGRHFQTLSVIKKRPCFFFSFSFASPLFSIYLLEMQFTQCHGSLCPHSLVIKI